MGSPAPVRPARACTPVAIHPVMAPGIHAASELPPVAGARPWCRGRALPPPADRTGQAKGGIMRSARESPVRPRRRADTPGERQNGRASLDAAASGGRRWPRVRNAAAASQRSPSRTSRRRRPPRVPRSRRRQANRRRRLPRTRSSRTGIVLVAARARTSPFPAMRMSDAPLAKQPRQGTTSNSRTRCGGLGQGGAISHTIPASRAGSNGFVSQPSRLSSASPAGAAGRSAK